MPSLQCSSLAAAAVTGWSSLFESQEAAKMPSHVMVPAKKPAYGGKKSLELCTEALGCETGAVEAPGADETAGAADGAVWKRRAMEEVPSGGGSRLGCHGLPPPLTTLVGGAGRVRLVRERRDGRLAVYAVGTPGMEAERGGGRLRLRLVPCGGAIARGCDDIQELHETEEEEQSETDVVAVEEEQSETEVVAVEEEHGLAKYTRGGRCVEEGGGATRQGSKKWEAEQAAFWVATS